MAEKTNGQNSGQVLVVEDESLIQMAYEDLLSEAGFKVVQAYDGDEALRALKEQVFLVVILDLHLRKVSGYDVLEQWPAGLMTPIIVISGNIDPDKPDLGNRPGAGNVRLCMQKPIDMRRLAGAIDKISCAA